MGAALCGVIFQARRILREALRRLFAKCGACLRGERVRVRAWRGMASIYQPRVTEQETPFSLSGKLLLEQYMCHSF